jgi:hypothetical protein
MPNSISQQPFMVSQQLGINKAPQKPNEPIAVSADKQDKNQPITLEVEVLKRGDKAAQTQADDIFAQANSYASVSPKVQQSLQAYQSLALSDKREALSDLMGIDLYA